MRIARRRRRSLGLGVRLGTTVLKVRTAIWLFRRLGVPVLREACRTPLRAVAPRTPF